MRWYLENEDGEYRDYALDIPDTNGHGGRLCLTLNADKGTAYMVIVLDDESGARFVEKDIPGGVPMAWARVIAEAADQEATP